MVKSLFHSFAAWRMALSKTLCSLSARSSAVRPDWLMGALDSPGSLSERYVPESSLDTGDQLRSMGLKAE